ncbi:shikimate kinase AroK [Salinibius halmophilus]|uniref:shikimate kinase AroK n=1 Tax=Salinibius halmophilus TaxID=1853216 RepID=UPI000E65EF54|nr:shikimate kinase AroK [Salinibius halmophilus]
MALTTIALVGPMGAGKSTIGRLLSERLSRPFVDSDKEIEERAGASIPWIFDIEGEKGFREREQQTLFELLEQGDMVLATGGGIVGRDANRKMLRKYAQVVYLQTSVATQLARTAADKNRPLLQTDNPEQVLTDLLAKREPWYQDVADITVSTDVLTPEAVVEEIIRGLHGNH